MKFLCVDCDRQMTFEERALPGDGTLAATFKCPKCGRVMALLTNPMETQLVSSLGVEIGGRAGPTRPLGTGRGVVTTGRGIACDDGGREHGEGRRADWSAEGAHGVESVPDVLRGRV